MIYRHKCPGDVLRRTASAAVDAHKRPQLQLTFWIRKLMKNMKLHWTCQACWWCWYVLAVLAALEVWSDIVCVSRVDGVEDSCIH